MCTQYLVNDINPFGAECTELKGDCHAKIFFLKAHFLSTFKGADYEKNSEKILKNSRSAKNAYKKRVD